MHSSVLKPPDGQGAAFNEVALQHLDALYRYAMSLTHNKVESEDLVQETYLRALRASGRLRPDSNVKSWLFTILRNVRLNEVQRPALNLPNVDFDRDLSANARPANSSAEDPHLSYVSAMRYADVRRAIETLPAAHREIIVLREFEDLSYEEIAQILNCRPGTVMSRLAMAREQLKQVLHCWYERVNKPPRTTEELS